MYLTGVNCLLPNNLLFLFRLLTQAQIYCFQKKMGNTNQHPLNFGVLHLDPLYIFFLANLVPKLQNCANNPFRLCVVSDMTHISFSLSLCEPKDINTKLHLTLLKTPWPQSHSWLMWLANEKPIWSYFSTKKGWTFWEVYLLFFNWVKQDVVWVTCVQVFSNVFLSDLPFTLHHHPPRLQTQSASKKIESAS